MAKQWYSGEPNSTQSLYLGIGFTIKRQLAYTRIQSCVFEGRGNVGYIIEYIVLCDKGKVRAKNQDNFWCAGTFLESENDGLGAPIENSSDVNECPVFALFDGMGGENYGETAAYVAAKTFDAFANSTPKRRHERFLYEACEKMNDEICDYAKTNRTGRMGTTVAIVAFDKKNIHICNVGDSKVYRQSAGKLVQISQDHVTAIAGKKPALTQHLGIPKTDFIIEPFVTKLEYKNGDRFLMCSDGLTDMVAHGKIEEILATQKDILVCTNTLMNTALTNGGKDNITIFLCDVQKKKWILGRAKDYER